MGNYLRVYTLTDTGNKKRIGNYRCRSCAKNHMLKNRPCFILTRNGKMVMYNAEYKNRAKREGWKLDGQEVRK